MKKIKQLIILLLIMPMLLVLSSCSHIDDLNGEDDYTLATLTDEDIINKNNSVSSFSIGSASKNEYAYVIKKISGVKEIKSLKVNNNQLVIYTDLKVSKGNCKLVLIKDKKIIKEFKINENDNFVTSENGTYIIKLAAESAQIELKINLSY